jgi:hypothetical protein
MTLSIDTALEYIDPHTGRPVLPTSVQDTPIFQAVGLYREQGYKANGGHRTITREFHA